MPRLSADEIADALGTPKPERTEPTTSNEVALSKIGELDGRLENLSSVTGSRARPTRRRRRAYTARTPT